MELGRVLEKGLIRVLLIVLIVVASSALIRYVTSPTPPASEAAAQQQKFDSAQDQKFRALFDNGSKAFQEGQYTEALSQYQEAERVVPMLRDEQYTALKNAREQIAELYETGGSRAEAERLYKDMIESAFRDGAAQEHAQQLEAALNRYQDAYKLTDHLTEAQEIYRIRANKGEVVTLQHMNRYADAVNAAQSLIDSLQAADENDPAIVQVYMSIGETYQMQQDWQHLETTLVTAARVCDKILERNKAIPYNQDPVWKISISEDQILYALMDAYDQDRKPDEALATAQTLYDLIAQYSTPYSELPVHGRKEVATSAFRIATRANRPDIASTWRARIDAARP